MAAIAAEELEIIRLEEARLAAIEAERIRQAEAEIAVECVQLPLLLLLQRQVALPLTTLLLLGECVLLR